MKSAFQYLELHIIWNSREQLHAVETKQIDVLKRIFLRENIVSLCSSLLASQ